MKKRGQQKIIVIIILIIMVLLLVVIIANFLRIYLKNRSEEFQLQTMIIPIDFDIKDVDYSDDRVTILIKRGSDKVKIKSETQVLHPISLDFVSVIDLSLSMNDRVDSEKDKCMKDLNSDCCQDNYCTTEDGCEGCGGNFDINNGVCSLDLNSDCCQNNNYCTTEDGCFNCNGRLIDDKCLAYKYEMFGDMSCCERKDRNCLLPEGCGACESQKVINFCGRIDRPDYCSSGPDECNSCGGTFDFNNGECSQPSEIFITCNLPSNCEGTRETGKNPCEGIWTPVDPALIIEKIDLAKRANENLIDNILSKNDENPGKMYKGEYNHKVGLVGFSNSAFGFPLSNDKQRLIDELEKERWTPNGETCICCGIEEAIEMLSESGGNQVKSMIVLTDGVANVDCYGEGPTKANNNAIQAAQKAYENHGISVHVIGFGQDSDQNRQIAQAGGGKYSYADTSNLEDVYSDATIQIIKEYEDEIKWNHLKVVFYDESGNTYIHRIMDLIGPLETEEYIIPESEEGTEGEVTLKTYGIKKLVKIEIYLAVITSTGKEIIGPRLDIWENKEKGFLNSLLRFFKFKNLKILIKSLVNQNL